jgi:hypothetical protein
VLRSAQSPAELTHAGELVKDNENELTPAGKDRLRGVFAEVSATVKAKPAAEPRRIDCPFQRPRCLRPGAIIWHHIQPWFMTSTKMRFAVYLSWELLSEPPAEGRVNSVPRRRLVLSQSTHWDNPVFAGERA